MTFIIVVIAEDGTIFAYGPCAESRTEIWRNDLEVIFPYASVQVCPLKGLRSLLY